MRQTIIVTVLLGILAAGAGLMADKATPDHRNGSSPPGSGPDLVSTAALPVYGDTGFTGAIIPAPVSSTGGWLVGWSGWSGLSGTIAGMRDDVPASWGPAGAKALRRVAELLACRSHDGGFAAADIAAVVHAPPDQDYGSAVARYAIAANPDDADALYSLGLDYLDGKGIGQDRYAAARNLLAAAELGQPEA
jgi:hypothetical protein